MCVVVKCAFVGRAAGAAGQARQEGQERRLRGARPAGECRWRQPPRLLTITSRFIPFLSFAGINGGARKKWIPGTYFFFFILILFPFTIVSYRFLSLFLCTCINFQQRFFSFNFFWYRLHCAAVLQPF